jgi:predicted RNA-binding Zn-ribbon protein involved in translation (DUF1610 family)
MGFIICCNNKKCGASQEALLDKKTDDVYCSACGNIIDNVTSFAKASMRTMGQFKRTVKSQEAFAVKCEGCDKMSRPKLNKNKLVCPHCGKEHCNLQSAYVHAIKEYIRTNPVSSAGLKDNES